MPHEPDPLPYAPAADGLSLDASHDRLAELGYEAAYPALQSALWRDAQCGAEAIGCAS